MTEHISISFWFGEKCVESIHDLPSVPHKGDIISLDLDTIKGYFAIEKVVWSFTRIPQVLPPGYYTHCRIEIHLEDPR